MEKTECFFCGAECKYYGISYTMYHAYECKYYGRYELSRLLFEDSSPTLKEYSHIVAGYLEETLDKRKEPPKITVKNPDRRTSSIFLLP